MASTNEQNIRSPTPLDPAKATDVLTDGAQLPQRFTSQRGLREHGSRVSAGYDRYNPNIATGDDND